MKAVHILSEQDSYLQNVLAQIRDVEVQQDSMRFRENMRRLGFLMAYEVSKLLAYRAQEVKTPLGEKDTRLCAERPVIASVLRAGLALHQGVLELFDDADSAYVSAYRDYTADHKEFHVKVEYKASPSLDGRVLILCDPMLATGESMHLAYEALLRSGSPRHVHMLCAVASDAALDRLTPMLPDTVTLWCADLDPDLTDQSYILPGLGDAGDLAYGEKL